MRRVGQAAEREGIPCIVTPEDIDVSGAKLACVKRIIPVVPPSANRLLRMHYRKRMRELDAWKTLIFYSVNGESRTAVYEWAAGRNRLKVEIHIEHAQLFDKDNLYSAAKLPLDALVRLGFLADDSNEFIDLTVTQSRSKAKQTTISIYAPEKV